MFVLGVSDHIMVAHSMASEYFGPAQKLHGATYTVEVELRVPGLNRHHVVIDLGVLRAYLRDALATLDYRNLDEHPAFPDRSSTTERIAEHIASLLAARLAKLADSERLPEGSRLSVLLRESPVAWAAFERLV